MSTLKIFDLKGKHAGEAKVANEIANAEANGQMIKDYIVALRANARQWSANTKGRSEVNHTTKKPHPQKGTGRARQGCLVSPQFRGGGRVFAPKPKFDQHVKVNKKERQAAIRFLLSEKIRQGHLHVVDSFDMDAPQTKFVSQFLDAMKLSGRVLFLGEGHYFKIEMEEQGIEASFSISGDSHDMFIKSVRNIPKTSFLLAKNVSGYDLIVANHLVVTSAALDEINQWLS